MLFVKIRKVIWREHVSQICKVLSADKIYLFTEM
jgi:hypothetical protein